MPGLLDSIVVRDITIRNRIVMPPMGTNMAEPTGAVADGHIQHYAARAAAGVGLVIVEHTYVLPDGRMSDAQLGIHQDSLIPGLRRLAEAIKSHGAVAAIQTTHAGARTKESVISEPPVAPSAVPFPGETSVPKELDELEIPELVSAFAAAARRAMEAGFDAVEIHGAHGYLVGEFLSPLMNHRADAYGGSFENRLRFPLEVIAAVREEIGNKPLLYRLGADDMVPGGITQSDGAAIASEIARAGVDVVDISGGLGGASYPDREEVEGYFVDLAETIKRAVACPVIVVGGIKNPRFADAIVREGKADLVAVGRAMLADPDWAAKAIAELGG